MRSRRLSTTTDGANQRGFTIIELAISSTLFLLVSTVLLSLFHQSQRATDKAIESTDVTSITMLVFDKSRNELRGTRVLGPTTDGRLEYWKPRSVNGLPQLTALGRPDYLPGAPQAPDSAFLYLNSEGNLLCDFQGTTRNLLRMGDKSKLHFDWHASTHLLTLSGHVALKDKESDFLYKMHVNNNE